MRVVTVPGSGESFDLDRPGSVAAWNRALNRRFAMANVREHKNPFVRWIERRRRARVAACVPAFERALDVGAEDGSLASAWADKGRFTLLLDLDPAMLGQARGPRIAADAERLPVAPASLDVVVLSAVLEHVVDPAVALDEAVRVLRPGGTIVAYLPWDDAVVRVKRWARRLRIGLGKLHGDIAPGHLRVFDRARIRRLFAPVTRTLRVRLDPLSFGYYVEATV